MRPLWRVLAALISGLAIVFGVVAVSAWFRNSVDRADIAAAEIGALTFATALFASVVNWLKKPNAALGQMDGSTRSFAAADRLAVASASRWVSEAKRRRIATPAPATIRWGWASEDIASRRSDVIVPPAPGTGPSPLPNLGKPGELLGSGVVNRLHDEVYYKLPHGRLVLLGKAGAGKTGAMILLLLAALAKRNSMTNEQRSAVPVPVWLTMGGWDPDAVTLLDWAASVMNRDHPFLRAREYGSNAAYELLKSGRVVLFLDGLDEMPKRVRSRALSRISDESQSLRIIMTCRTEEYENIMESNHLDNTAVVELRPIRPPGGSRLLVARSGGRKTAAVGNIGGLSATEPFLCRGAGAG